MRRGIGLVVLSSSVAIARVVCAEPSEVERLRAENARLRARIHELEAENARLAGQGAGPLAAALEETAAASVTDKVDHAAGVTTTATTPSELALLDGGRTRQWFTLRVARQEGQPSTSPKGVTLVIETATTTGVYRTAKDLQLSVDGATQDLRVVDYRSEPITAGRSFAKVAEREIVVVSVPADVLARMAEAREVRGTLGPLSFRLTPGQLAAVRAFRQRIGG